MTSHASSPSLVARPRREARTQRTRLGQAALLTGITVALVAALGLTLGAFAAFLAVVTLPGPLVLLWMSADVFRADELER